jgi:hypothetical protein
MPTNRVRRGRNRRPIDIDPAMEELFTTGKVNPDSDCWDLWNRDLTYSTWARIRDRSYKAAWEVFETESATDAFVDFTWLDRRGFKEWKAANIEE